MVRTSAGYSLGVAVFELGELVPIKLSLRETALPFMQDLYEATHETVHLGIIDGLDVVYAEKIHGHAAASGTGHDRREELACCSLSDVVFFWLGGVGF
jgi:DNA-binding IclR family transcriptional regulator